MALSCCPSSHHPNDAICGHDHSIDRCGLAHPQVPEVPTTLPRGSRADQLERQLDEAIANHEQSIDVLRLDLATQLLADGFAKPSDFVAQQIDSKTASAPVFLQSLVVRQHALIQLNNVDDANVVRKAIKKLVNSVIK